MKTIFTKHPASVGETYWEHMIIALGFTLSMIFISMCCFIHAFLPFLFECTSSERIGRLYSRMTTYRIKPL